MASPAGDAMLCAAFVSPVCLVPALGLGFDLVGDCVEEFFVAFHGYTLSNGI